MALTVDEAFSEYMNDYVNLDPNVVEAANKSKNNLLENIHNFSNDNFFHLCPKYDIQFGSFSRKTKCRELDDIDLMIGISADGATYNDNYGWENVIIYASEYNKIQQNCSDKNGYLNSTAVRDLFKSKLSYLSDYNRSDLHCNGEAVNLNLISKDWAFDIVPCFHTAKDENGESFYLIPNKDGNWKKTNPKRDQFLINYIDIQKQGKLRPLIRLCKKWNKYKKMVTLESYLLETMLYNFGSDEEMKYSLKFIFLDALEYLANHIYSSVYDMKGIQGDINTLSYEDKKKIAQKCIDEHDKCIDALSLEFEDKNQKKAIEKWREIFGEDFPDYD